MTTYTIHTDTIIEKTTDLATAIDWLSEEQGVIFTRRYGRQQIIVERSSLAWHATSCATAAECAAVQTANNTLTTRYLTRL